MYVNLGTWRDSPVMLNWKKNPSNKETNVCKMLGLVNFPHNYKNIWKIVRKFFKVSKWQGLGWVKIALFLLDKLNIFLQVRKKGGAYRKRDRERKGSPEIGVDYVVVFLLWQIFSLFPQGVLRKDKRHQSSHSLCAMRLTSMIRKKYLGVQSEDSLTWEE